MELVTGTNIENCSVLLRKAKAGDVLRFAHDSYEVAHQEHLWWVRALEEPKEGRVKLLNPVTGEIIVRDDSHQVFIHGARLVIWT
jgi:hypothetical protein